MLLSFFKLINLNKNKKSHHTFRLVFTHPTPPESFVNHFSNIFSCRNPSSLFSIKMLIFFFHCLALRIKKNMIWLKLYSKRNLVVRMNIYAIIKKYKLSIFSWLKIKTLAFILKDEKSVKIHIFNWETILLWKLS